MNDCAEIHQESSIQQRLRALIDQHHKNLLREIESVRPVIQAIGGTKPADCHAVQQSIDITHKIAGSSGSMGFNEISEAAKKIETHLNSLAATDEDMPAADRDLLRQYFCDLEALIATVSPKDSDLYSAEDL